MAETSTTVVLESHLVRFLAGDPEAADSLVEHAYRRLKIIARGLLQQFPSIWKIEEAEAIVHASYEKLKRALEEVRPTTVRQFFGLASLQMKRVLLDLSRKGNRPNGPRPLVVGGSARGNSENGGFDCAGSQSGMSGARSRLDVWEALEKLPQDEREVVDLIFFHGLSQVEIGTILGVHKDTIKNRWARARILLADLLPGYASSA